MVPGDSPSARVAASASRQVSSSPPRSRVFGQTPSCTPAITTVSNSRPSAPAGVRMRTVSSRIGASRRSSATSVYEDAAHERARIGVERALDEALRGLEERDDGVEVAVRLLGEGSVTAGELATRGARGRCGPTPSTAARGPSRRAPGPRAACRACGRATAARRASRVSSRSNSSGRRIAETSRSRPDRAGAALSSPARRTASSRSASWRRAERSRRSSIGSSRPQVPSRASVTSSNVHSSRTASSMSRSRSRTGASVPSGRPGPLERAGTSRAASSASSAAT